MPRFPSTIPSWQRELLRLGRRKFFRDASGGGTLALEGFGPLEPAFAGVQGLAPSGFDRVVSIIEHRRRRARRVDSDSSADE
jgi:hypothetical protein